MFCWKTKCNRRIDHFKFQIKFNLSSELQLKPWAVCSIVGNIHPRGERHLLTILVVLTITLFFIKGNVGDYLYFSYHKFTKNNSKRALVKWNESLFKHYILICASIARYHYETEFLAGLLRPKHHSPNYV